MFFMSFLIFRVEASCRCYSLPEQSGAANNGISTLRYGTCFLNRAKPFRKTLEKKEYENNIFFSFHFFSNGILNPVFVAVYVQKIA